MSGQLCFGGSVCEGASRCKCPLGMVPKLDIVLDKYICETDTVKPLESCQYGQICAGGAYCSDAAKYVHSFFLYHWRYLSQFLPE